MGISSRFALDVVRRFKPFDLAFLRTEIVICFNFAFSSYEGSATTLTFLHYERAIEIAYFRAIHVIVDV